MIDSYIQRRHHNGLVRLGDEIQQVCCFFDRVRPVGDDDSIHIRHTGQFIKAAPSLSHTSSFIF
jgi:hypothetical protein